MLKVVGVFRIFGFLGGWLLFAGPVYQALVELREQRFAQAEATQIIEQLRAVPKPQISRWWWLFPPAAYLASRRVDKAWRLGALGALTPSQRERFLAFQQKAAGWLIVACGALFIAIKETGELVEHFELSRAMLALLIAVPFLLGVGYTVNQAGQFTKLHERWESENTSGNTHASQ